MGSQRYIREYVGQKLEKFNEKIRKLTRIAKTSPHVAYSLYQVHTKHEIGYLMRTASLTPDMLRETKKLLTEFAESIVGQKIVSKSTLEELSLPNTWGGISINACDLENEAKHQRKKSMYATAALKEKLTEQDDTLPKETDTRHLDRERSNQIKLNADRLKEEANAGEKSRMAENRLKGTSAWLDSLPIKNQGRYLNKSELQDAMKLRLGLPIQRLPRKCECGQDNSVVHRNCCKLGGYVAKRHNSIRDLLHAKAKMIFNDTEVEPKLLPVEEHTLAVGANRSDGARADVRINGYTGQYQNTFFDVQVINVQAPSHQNDTPKEAMRKAESKKEKMYKERIESIDGGTFIPLIFTTKGARTFKTAKTISSLARRSADKRKININDVMKSWSQEMSFFFLKAQLACVRGNRKRAHANGRTQYSSNKSFGMLDTNTDSHVTPSPGPPQG